MADAEAETRAMATNIRADDDDDDGEADFDDEGDEGGLGTKLGVPAVGPDGSVDLDLVKRRLKQVSGLGDGADGSNAKRSHRVMVQLVNLACMVAVLLVHLAATPGGYAHVHCSVTVDHHVCPSFQYVTALCYLACRGVSGCCCVSLCS